jgi:hypothetical protein
MATIKTASPTWQKVTVAHTAFQTAALTNTITLLSLPASGIVHAARIKHSVAFAGTSITAYIVSVGITGALQDIADNFDVFQAVADTSFELVGSGVRSYASATSTDIKITATSVGANLSASSAGSVNVWLLVSATM